VAALFSKLCHLKDEHVTKLDYFNDKRKELDASTKEKKGRKIRKGVKD
jgi:hypothetical protein